MCIRDRVEDGATGLLVGEKQPVALADAIAELLADPAKARRFGACGKAAVAERFASSVTVAQLRKLIERAVG